MRQWICLRNTFMRYGIDVLNWNVEGGKVNQEILYFYQLYSEIRPQPVDELCMISCMNLDVGGYFYD